VTKAQKISDALPPDYPQTKQEVDALILAMSEAEPRCSDWYSFAFKKAP
jgi:hypothetical protein